MSDIKRMKAAEFSKWMQKHGKNTADVASATRVSPRTVERFLSGENVRPVILAAFERLVRESEKIAG